MTRDETPRTCGECEHAARKMSLRPRGALCGAHAERDDAPRLVRLDAAPPEWCPRREEER
jgi:hypothetical protein